VINREALAYALARESFEFHGWDEEWDDRQHFRVPIMYWLAIADKAIEFIEEYDATH
jgi:hypothetical protein